jgi:hypothetical protein
MYLKVVQCGGRLKYLRRSPASRRRRRKRNPVPGGILGHPVTGGHKYRDLVLQIGGLDAGLTDLALLKKLQLRTPKK